MSHDARFSVARSARTGRRSSISAATTDNGIARIYLGVHFNNENTDPAAVGVEVGTYVYESDLTKAAVTPVPPPAADPGK